MSGGSAGPAGVKNLRAMFENKHSDQSTSPPSRGRSPNGSVSSANPNSRPVSTVRASFVSVEHPGETSQPAQLGLMEQSDVSNMAEAREQPMVGDVDSAVDGSIANEARASSANEPGLGVILKGSPFEGAAVPEPEPEQPNSTAEPGTPRSSLAEQNLEKSKMNGSTTKVTPAMDSARSRDNPTPKSESATKKSAKPLPSSLDTKTAAPKSSNSPTTPRKSPLLQKKTQQSPPTVNGYSPAIRTRGGVSKIQGVMQSADKAKDERAKAEQSKMDAPREEKRNPLKNVKAPSVASKPTAASRAHAQKQDAVSTEPKQPRSPTTARSGKLPAAAMKSTAASAARKDANYESEEAAKATAERVSRMVGAPRANASASTRASLAKKSTRSSLANGDERAKPSKARTSTAQKPADESFLARLTRPTAASAQKTHEKVQVNSPPRPRQTSATYTGPKKPSRKSLNLPQTNSDVAKPAPASTEQPNGDPPLPPVHEDAKAPPMPELVNRDDEGEPEQAEEDVSMPVQQADAEGTTSA